MTVKLHCKVLPARTTVTKSGQDEDKLSDSVSFDVKGTDKTSLLYHIIFKIEIVPLWSPPGWLCPTDFTETNTIATDDVSPMRSRDIK